LYAGIPLTLGYQLNKVSINIGFQLNYSLLASEFRKGTTLLDSGKIDSWSFSQNAPITNFDFGMKTGASYKITNRYEFELNHYHGLHNIYRYAKKGYVHNYD